MFRSESDVFHIENNRALRIKQTGKLIVNMTLVVNLATGYIRRVLFFRVVSRLFRSLLLY
jgi:hypothetical protein